MQENYENMLPTLAARIYNMQTMLVLANQNAANMRLVIDSILAARPNIEVSCSSLLHIACSYGDAEAIQYFINAGIYINTTDNQWRTPLHLACRNGNFEVAQCLVFNKADVNLQDRDGWTPLHLLTNFSNDIKFMRLLLDQRADCNASDDEGVTPFHIVCRPAITEVLELFMEYDALINLPNNYGYTPLHIACEHGNAESIRFLLGNGAANDITSTNEVGQTPLHVAIDSYLSDLLGLVNLDDNAYTELDAV